MYAKKKDDQGAVDISQLNTVEKIMESYDYSGHDESITLRSKPEHRL